MYSFWLRDFFFVSLFKNENTKAIGNNVEFENSGQFIGLINIRKTNPFCKGILKREQHRKDLLREVKKLFAYESYPKGLVLTGESGAGKSTLLRLFCQDLKDEGYVVYLNEAYNGIYEEEGTDDYIVGLPKSIEKDKRYVLICDQFEGYLQHDAVEKWINDNKDEFNNCVFLFSFPQKFITEIYTKIYSAFNSFYLQTYVLYLNDEDEKKYWEKIEKATRQSNLKNDWQNAKSPMARVLAEELIKVKSGKAPLVELEFLGKMLQDNIGGNSVTIDNFIELRFNEWVDKFDNRETAYAILTLFTSFDSYRIKDIKHVTFESKENFDSILNIFNDTDFLNRYLGGFSEADTTNDDVLLFRHMNTFQGQFKNI